MTCSWAYHMNESYRNSNVRIGKSNKNTHNITTYALHMVYNYIECGAVVWNNKRSVEWVNLVNKIWLTRTNSHFILFSLVDRHSWIANTAFTVFKWFFVPVKITFSLFFFFHTYFCLWCKRKRDKDIDCDIVFGFDILSHHKNS